MPIHNADVLLWLSGQPDDSFDALLCDPPYGLRFMGKKWDYDVPSVDVWREALRVLKPGAPLLAFGGTRTWHRIAIGIEDAGFEIRDSIAWMYASGFPKSQNISIAIDEAAFAAWLADHPIEKAWYVGATRWIATRKASATRDSPAAELRRVIREASGLARPVVGKGQAWHAAEGAGGSFNASPGSFDLTGPATPLAASWEGYGTALKPAFEPVIVARKPLEGTMAANVARWGVGGLDVEACRIGTDGGGTNCPHAPGPCRGHEGHGRLGRTVHAPARGEDVGRWPANVILDEAVGATLDEQVGDRPSTPYRANVATGAVLPMTTRTAGGYEDSGGAARFFFCAKTSTAERELGCDALPLRSAGEMVDREDGAPGAVNARSGASPDGGARNHHPTLKPIALTRYLARYVLPPARDGVPRRLLVPFAGAGSEMIGAVLAGWEDVQGIELEPDYVAIANARLALAFERPGIFDAEMRASVSVADPRQLSLLGGA